MLSASARRPQTTRPRRIYYKRRGRTGVPSAEQSNEIVQPPLTRKHLQHLSKWLEYAAAYQPKVTAKTASLVSGTYDAILCTREEWQERLKKSPNTVSLYRVNFGKFVLLPTAIMGNVQILELLCCQMTYVPDSFGRLTNLTHLYLSYNRLRSLPDSIGRLTNLTELYLCGNRLESLPDVIGRLTNLTHLNLIGNRLISLPDSIGQLTSLTKLYLNRNWLESLPDTIGQLINLSDLGINSNNLTSLPDTIGQLSNLTYWMIDHQLYVTTDWSRYPGLCAPRWTSYMLPA